MKPIVAIVGRPNVGKSTLFNRIIGRRKAMVDDQPGVTRDRNYGNVNRFEVPFILIDTGGFEPETSDRLLQQMREQSQLAMEEADVILFVMDGRDGLDTCGHGGGGDAAPGGQAGLLHHQQGRRRPAGIGDRGFLLPRDREHLYRFRRA